MIGRPPRNVKPSRFPGLVAGLLAGVACGSIGPWIATRRIVFVAGALAHMADQRVWPT